MSKIKNIINGWGNYIFPSAYIENLAQERAKKCGSCKHAKEMLLDTFMPDYTIKCIKGLACDICKCPLSTKLRSEEETCPQNKW